MDKIFEPYFTTKSQGKGTGLGLAVVYGIIQEYKGDIKVRSEVGKGARFDVYLPQIRKAERTETPKPMESLPIGIERILLVDDEEPIAQLEKLILERLGYRVTSRVSSVEALEAFKTSEPPFDLVITDMTMPNMTGDQLAEQIHAIAPQTPIIICTGFSERLNPDTFDTLGIKAVLMKPIIRNELAQTVRKVLDGKP
jgi:CheY-like chemotaxis protein